MRMWASIARWAFYTAGCLPLALMAATPSFATTTIPGTTSIYAVAGSTAGSSNTNDGTEAVSFSVVGGQTYNITATGTLNCCNGDSTYDGGPDGIQISPFDSTVGVETNGLSALTGNSFLGLVGVFGDGSDPRGNASPAALAFDANNPSSVAPELWQIFYIGDGRSGYENPLGSLLDFTAPSGATVLYLGLIDHGPGGALSPCCYGDNIGSLEALVAPPAVPLPAAFPLFGSVLLGSGLLAWRSKRKRAAA